MSTAPGHEHSAGTLTSVDRLLEGLTEDQRLAVTIGATRLRILAGAGSGKTRVLTRRIAHQAKGAALEPQHTLALTFTRKAAGELRRRLRAAFRLQLRQRGDLPRVRFLCEKQLL